MTTDRQWLQRLAPAGTVGPPPAPPPVPVAFTDLGRELVEKADAEQARALLGAAREVHTHGIDDLSVDGDNFLIGTPPGESGVSVLGNDGTLYLDRGVIGREAITGDVDIGRGETEATVLASRFPRAVGGLLRCPCHASTQQITVSGTAYFCYVGYLPAGTVIKRVQFAVSTAGAGAQTAEVGVFTGSAPTAGVQTLTKVWASGTLDSLTTTGLKANNADNTTALGAAAHVWLAARFAMATTQPTLHTLQRDWGRGFLSQASGAAALTGINTVNATPVTFAANTSPELRGLL